MSLSPVFVELRAATGQFQLKMAEAEATLHRLSRQGATNFDKLAAAGRGAFLGVSAAGVVVGAASVKMAADFQQATNQLITSAGESRKNIDLVRKGLLDMSTEVGSSATELAKGMYLVESAGFHGAEGLKVMRAAAQGAKAEGANFETVANAVTSAMNAYKIPADQAVQVTNALVATVASGKMRMEDLAGAIGGVLPVASTAHISLSEVGAAMATMSAQGTPASVAATYLRQTIGQLENPSKKARNEMAALGISALDVSANLGARGLAGTLEFLTQAIERKMGPAGVAIMGTLRKASGESGKFEKALNELPPSAQTYVGALATMVGGVKTMQAALQLSGPHLKDFRANTAKVAEGARDASKDVRGWDIVQQNFNQKLAVLHAQLGRLAVELGTRLIPVIEAVVGWMTRHKNIVAALAAVIGGALVVAMAAYVAKLTLAAAQTLLLITRTVALNAQVAIAIVRNGANAAAMDAETAAAARLSMGLKGAAASMGALALAGGAMAAFPDLHHDLDGTKGLSDQQKKLFDRLIQGRGPGKASHDDEQAVLNWLLKGGNPKHDKRLQAIIDSLRLLVLGGPSTAQEEAADRQAHRLAQTIAQGKGGKGGKGKSDTTVGSFNDQMVDVSKIERQLAAAAATHKATSSQTQARLIAQLRMRLAEEKRLALLAQQATFNAREKTLQAALAAAREATRQAELAAKLAYQGGDLSLINGSVLNRGSSFATMAQQKAQTTIIVKAGGVYMSLDQLKNAITDAQRVEARQNVTVGLS